MFTEKNIIAYIGDYIAECNKQGVNFKACG